MPAPDHLSTTSQPPLAKFEAARDGPEGRYVIYSADTPVQLVFYPTGETRAPLVALIPIDAETLTWADVLTRFWRAVYGRRPLPDKRLTRQQRRRLRLMLQAVDGRTNGASYREIAIAIYGAEHVASDPWKTSPLRDSVIGLVEGGSALVGGGYLDLLRHRRRS